MADPKLISEPEIETFIEQANSHNPTINFTADISDTEAVFLDTVTLYIQRQQIRGTVDPSYQDKFKAGGNLPVHSLPRVTHQVLKIDS